MVVEKVSADDGRAPAARHDEIEPVHGAQHLADRSAVGGGHELHAILGQAGTGQRLAQKLDDGAR